MIPDKVFICGIPYRVEFCHDNFDSDLHFGMIDYSRALIKINCDASEELQMQTLFHEMLHGMLVMIGRSDESQDERLVQGLANAMYQSFCLKDFNNIPKGAEDSVRSGETDGE